jgi:uncharacterized membrane protein HdeD (DUF308 family)
MDGLVVDRDVALEFTRGWWMFVLRGVLAIVFGVVAWVWPEITVTILVIVLGAYVIADGIMLLLSAFVGRGLGFGSRLLLALAGLATIVLGLVVWIWPDITAKIVMILFGVWATVLGIGAIAFAIAHRRTISSAWVLGLIGLAAAIFGIVVIVDPGAGALSLIWLLGVFSIALGCFLIAYGFFLRSAKNRLEQQPPATAGLSGA